MENKDIIQLLQKSKVIAIVGLSNSPEQDSYHVATYLKQYHYKIIPVNPKYAEILGEKSYPNLSAIPFPIDIVNVFRRATAIPEIAQEALKMSPLPKGFWMQLGISNSSASEELRKAGIIVVENRCIKIEHHTNILELSH